MLVNPKALQKVDFVGCVVGWIWPNKLPVVGGYVIEPNAPGPNPPRWPSYGFVGSLVTCVSTEGQEGGRVMGAAAAFRGTKKGPKTRDPRKNQTYFKGVTTVS